jgi:hypothetical protein
LTLIIRELQPGDCFTQRIQDCDVQFEVLKVARVGRRYQVTFQSPLGVETARYGGEAVITASTH